MFKKVLIVDDHDSVSEGVSNILTALGIKNFIKSHYCDDAYLKIKRGIIDDKPYDLLITDLSFKKDYRENKISTGEELIKTLRHQHPELKIIVYSMEDRFQVVRKLVKDHEVDAYVCKGRKGLKELHTAIENVYTNKLFLSPNVENATNSKSNLEITDYDVNLIKQLSKGLSQEEISHYFKKNNISPSSLSSIEKNLNKLKTQFKASNTTHLISITKDLGLI